jgi:hypothetical protein
LLVRKFVFVKLLVMIKVGYQGTHFM